MFQRVSNLKSWVVGSLQSDAGSDYLFGYDTNRNSLMWLERTGVEYSPADPVWDEAENYIRTSAFGEPPIERDYRVPEMESADVMVEIDANELRPKTVTRSVAADFGDHSIPQAGDPRIVGDFSEEGQDFDDDDIAAQAAEFLMTLGEDE